MSEKESFVELKLVLAAVVLLGAIAFFYPKPAGGTCGFCPPAPYPQREEYDCLGFKFDEVRNCPDCGIIVHCAGIPYGEKKCYTYPDSSSSKYEPVACRQPG